MRARMMGTSSVRVVAIAVMAGLLSGCRLIDVPTNRFEMLPTGIVAATETFGPVQLLDERGRVVRTLAEHGAGPWRAPDGSAIYFVRYACDEAVAASRPAARPCISGTLYRANPDGLHELTVELPDRLIPCQVAVSHSGRYLAITAISVSDWMATVLGDGQALPLLPRTLFVLDRQTSTCHEVQPSWTVQQGTEFAWSPRDDTLALLTAIDISQQVAACAQVVVQHLAEWVPVEQRDALFGAPAAGARKQGKVHLERETSLGQIMFSGPDTLVKAPRVTEAVLWHPDRAKLEEKLSLIRPSYAGFAWLPDGRELLLFSVDVAPRPLNGGALDAVFPIFLCHRWNPQSGTLRRIPAPRPDAFTALPSPDGHGLLWVCGNQKHTLIVTSARGEGPRTVVSDLLTTHLPHWQDDRTVTFIRAAETVAKKVKDPRTGSLVDRSVEIPPRRVVVDTRTMESKEYELEASAAFRKTAGW